MTRMTEEQLIRVATELGLTVERPPQRSMDASSQRTPQGGGDINPQWRVRRKGNDEVVFDARDLSEFARRLDSYKPDDD